MPESTQRLALFDFDGTVCSGNTLHVFMQVLLAKRRGVPGLLAWSVLRKLRLAGTRRLKNGVLTATRGLPAEELRLWGREIYRERVRPRLRSEALREIADLRVQGYRVVVVTGAFDFLVEPFCAEYGVRDLLCCRVGMAGGRCTGSIAGSEMRGADKVAAIRELARGTAVDWAGSRAYTDEAGDEPMLALVGEKFQVRGERAIPGTKTLEWHRTLGDSSPGQ
jgi:HAD superfamily hydrolase (TIGR01490 family)